MRTSEATRVPRKHAGPAPAAKDSIPEHPQPEGRAAAIYVKVADLLRRVRNPRKNAKAVPGVVASIKAYGFGNPLLARLETREIIAGDTRILAAAQLGLVEVPVRYMTLDELKAHALSLADNVLGEIAEWEKRERAELVRELESQGVDLEPIGFDEDTLEAMLMAPTETKVTEIDVSQVHDEFWMSVRGPLPKQPDALEALRKTLASIDGVTVDMGTVE